MASPRANLGGGFCCGIDREGIEMVKVEGGGGSGGVAG